MTGRDQISALFGNGVADLAVPAFATKVAQPLTAGFVALLDCAPLIVARDKGFAAAEGLELELVREPSWANIRDRLALGHFDAAHLLAPMAIAATLRPGAIDAPLFAPIVLDYGGNAISVSNAVHASMLAVGPIGTIKDPSLNGSALKRVVMARKSAGLAPLTFGMTYPFSSHNYELRYWLAAAGIDPDRDVRLVVVPPPQMVEAMLSGYVDGSCVGSPWPSMTVAAAAGHVVATTAALKPSSPEKVLGVRKSWAERHPDRLDRIVRALSAACAWCDDPQNGDELARLLARPEIVDAPVEVIRSLLSLELTTDVGALPVKVPDYIRFLGATANRPRIADALWYATQMVRWGQVASLDVAIEAARATFRPDLYDRALGLTPAPMSQETGFALFDGIAFDPTEPDVYLDKLAGPFSSTS